MIFSFLRKFNKLIRPNQFNFCKSKTYTVQYYNLKVQLQQRKQILQSLKQQSQFLQKMSQTSFIQTILKSIYQTITKKSFQTKAIQQHREILLNLRNQLQNKIQQSSVLWQEPRKLILDERQNKINQFLQRMIIYERKMAEFILQIQKRKNTNKQQLQVLDEGIILNHKLLLKNLIKEGCIKIQPQQDEKFINQQHQPIVNKNSQKKDFKIKSVILPGWKIKQKIIIKAKVEIK